MAKRETESESSDWRHCSCRHLAAEIERKLAPLGFAIYFKKIERLGRDGGASTVSFVISRIHEFPNSELSGPPNSSIRVKAGPAARATSKFQSEIANALERDYYIARLSHSYMASRLYVFEICYVGTIVVEKIFSTEELWEYDTVAEALEAFQDEISSQFEFPFSIIPSQSNLTRRPRNNQYTFDVQANPHCSFHEGQVFGDGRLMFDWEAPTEKFSGLIEWRDGELDQHTEYLRFEFENACDQLPSSLRVIESSIKFLDWDDDLVEVIEQIDHA